MFLPNSDGVVTEDCKLEINPFLIFNTHSGSDGSLQTSVMVDPDPLIKPNCTGYFINVSEKVPSPPSSLTL